MTSVRIALTTCNSAEEAAVLARALIERKVVACVNIIPGVRSVYRWQGEIHDDAEALLVMKTDIEHLAALQEAVAELHRYDVPEFIALPVESGAPAYLDWIAESLA